MAGYAYDLGVPEATVIPVASGNIEAQRWFRLGYAWAAGFHREEAAHCFEEAIKLDPTSALAQWGLAISHGPDYNFSERRGFYSAANKETGWPSMLTGVTAAARAKELSVQPGSMVLPPHRAMIDALTLRYEWPISDETTPELKHKYSDAMAAVHDTFPDNAEVAIMAAEAVAALRPWDLYDRQVGTKPKLNNVGVRFKAYVTAGLKVAPKNHWLCHLSVHLNEMGPVEDFNWAAAEVLRDPCVAIAGHGHLLHMPTHLDIQVGKYDAAMKWNIAGYTADEKTMKACPRTTVWTGYYVHNIEFCAWASLYGAHRENALEAAKTINAALPVEFLAASDQAAKYYEPYSTLETMVLVRFGMWDELLQLPFRDDPAVHLMYTLFLRFGRGVAYGAKGDVAAARAEQAAFLELLPTLKPGDRVKHNVDGADMAAIAADVLAGEVLYREGRYSEAFAVLRNGITKTNALPYDEPHGWLMSVRQTLAALLTEQGEYTEAIRLYREDLEMFPDNVWSLTGLKNAYGGQLADVEVRLAKATEAADVVVGASCACALSHFNGKGKGAAQDCCPMGDDAAAFDVGTVTKTETTVAADGHITTTTTTTTALVGTTVAASDGPQPALHTVVLAPAPQSALAPFAAAVNSLSRALGTAGRA
mmetsp:Transcript_31932/g.83681  ORF Transcript_31932/g.83681 Transcript_31932/m.83681 type:complete len:648 (+) Transcript_31932:88-2031(+)